MINSALGLGFFFRDFNIYFSGFRIDTASGLGLSLLRVYNIYVSERWIMFVLNDKVEELRENVFADLVNSVHKP